MATGTSAKEWFYIDKLRHLRILEPEIRQKPSELTVKCKEFLDKMKQFEQTEGGLTERLEELGKEVEKEKLKAIGARNLLELVANQRETQRRQLQAKISEKRMQLKRLRIEQEILSEVEAKQKSFIHHFTLQR
ncbi:intraflagellar transport protein 20 homolog [Aulostomus maculatus]